ncbi:hypothetical protein BTH42_29140 [Burkholderia sp. SRS-W-2-2016]|uniref:hypothetical protein n=1 Tax=Burkholderia sp. SRS-W-2-2016 TaxID=1926878 RepID=UPI00094B1876|nr:hypothetical protein [Burkholderia sp. SRS-W-2-2016]OLL28045.1 hypothetical protein BTH42_29140 [Burkholderia sp. SRS-W-2-2016]
MNTIEKYEFFHDWYLTGISADLTGGTVELALMFDDREKRARLLFKGASRCLVNDFLIQNIISEVRILTDHSTHDYGRALDALEKSYFGKASGAPKPIAVFSATLGAELLIEFETLEIDAA